MRRSRLGAAEPTKPENVSTTIQADIFRAFLPFLIGAIVFSQTKAGKKFRRSTT